MASGYFRGSRQLFKKVGWDEDLSHETLWKVLLSLSHNSHGGFSRFEAMPLDELYRVASYLSDMLPKND
jgi:hypothetical protein